MPLYHRVMSVVEASDDNRDLIRRAARIAGLCRAKFAIAELANSTVEECIQSRVCSINDSTARLEKEAKKSGLTNFDVLFSERDRYALSAAVWSWNPDLLVVSALDPLGLEGWTDLIRTMRADCPIDVLKIDPTQSGLMRRVATFAGFI